MLYQLVSLVGAVIVLAAYAGLQSGRLARDDVSFALANFVGSALLTWVAVIDRRVGFILLEGLWALMSLAPLVQRARARSR